MDDEWEYSISNTADITKPIMCTECGVTLSESEMSRHTLLCDKQKKEYERKLKEKAQGAALKRKLEELLR